MNERDPMKMLTDDAAKRAEAMERRLVDDAIIGGATDAATLLDKQEVREQIAKVSFMGALASQNTGDNAPPRSPGPARRAKKRPTKRQRVKAARRRNR